MKLKHGVIGGSVLLAAALITLIVLAAGAKCPKGQHMTIVAWIPIVIGKVITLSPVYACR